MGLNLVVKVQKLLEPVYSPFPFFCDPMVFPEWVRQNEFLLFILLLSRIWWWLQEKSLKLPRSWIHKKICCLQSSWKTGYTPCLSNTRCPMYSATTVWFSQLSSSLNVKSLLLFTTYYKHIIFHLREIQKLHLAMWCFPYMIASFKIICG